MATRSSPSAFWEESYIHLTLRPLNCLAFILVPLTIYHVYALVHGTMLLAPQDLGRLLGYFGATAGFLPPLLIVVVLLSQHAVLGHPWRVHLLVLGGMLVESGLWVVPLFSLNYFTWRVLQAAGTVQPVTARDQVMLALGAGIYEEFIFRLVLVGLMALLLLHVIGLRKTPSAVIAIFVGAALFSLYHLSGPQIGGAAPLPWGDVIFRALAGAYLGGLYVCRGFGIAVGTHAVWNILVAFINS